jgi:hydroxymethylglutaryl-CoA lyase
MKMKNHLNLPKAVSLYEMCIGEGCQAEQKFIPTEVKVFMVKGLIDAGFKRIFVGNFGHPEFVPQFRDIEEVFRQIPYRADVLYYTPINNVYALKRAISLKSAGFGPQVVSVGVATTDAFNLSNVGKTTEEQWKEVEGITKMARDAGFKVLGGIVGVWHCTLTGRKVPESVPYEFAKRWVDLGADQIHYAEGSTGRGVTPTEVYTFFSGILDKYPNPNLHCLHFHDAYGFGLACVITAMQAGIINFDCCMGGAGGHVTSILDGIPCRGSKKAPMDLYIDPNRMAPITTEDLVAMLNHMGIETGVEEDKVFNLGRWWEKILGRKLWSFCLKTMVGERWDNDRLWHYTEE